MIFSTFEFILVFLPIVFGLYSVSLSNGKIQLSKIILILSSLVFYAWGSGSFFYTFLLAIFMNYLMGNYLSSIFEYKSTWYKRFILWGAISLNLCLLGYYKYTDFILINSNFIFNSNFELQNILLPIGISFFTFQLVAYLVDSYRGETKNYDLTNYLLFITFFPQLIVGPIVHHKDVVPQYKALKKSKPNSEKIARGTFLFFIGCSKKLLIADPLSSWAQSAFDQAQTLNSVESWLASVSYTLSYYFDLSGYADMAIGLGIIFGITLPMNFNSPYKARNFADYWRRWHMTLSKFLGDYIFRNIYVKSKGDFNFYFAIFITFFVSGFWHGAGWTFVVWGIINGVFVIFSHIMIKAKIKFPLVIAWSLTFLGIVSTRVLFVADDFTDAFHVLYEMFTFSFSYREIEQSSFAVTQPLYIVIGLALVLLFPNSGEILTRFKSNYKYLLMTTSLITLSLLNMSYVRGFLYFQF